MGDVLVTGGTGGLGRELVPKLVAAGHTVRITSRDAGAAAAEGVAVQGVDLASGRGLAEAVHGVLKARGLQSGADRGLFQLEGPQLGALVAILKRLALAEADAALAMVA